MCPKCGIWLECVVTTDCIIQNTANREQDWCEDVDDIDSPTLLPQMFEISV